MAPSGYLPKLTLRDLFALVTIVALGWWVDRSRLAERHASYWEEWNPFYERGPLTRWPLNPFSPRD